MSLLIVGHDDPATSRKAARMISLSRSKVCHRLLRWLEARGDTGMTPIEAGWLMARFRKIDPTDQKATIKAYTTASRRIYDLKYLEVAQATSRERGGQQVWMPTGKSISEAVAEYLDGPLLDESEPEEEEYE